jgi:hypothetical protein
VADSSSSRHLSQIGSSAAKFKENHGIPQYGIDGGAKKRTNFNFYLGLK